MKKTILIAVAFTGCIMACTKGDDNSSVSIVGKWNANTAREKKVDLLNSSNNHDITQSYAIGSYLDFRNDGKIYGHHAFGTTSFTNDTFFYNLSANKLTIINSTRTDTNFVSVLTLTNSQLSLYEKNDDIPLALVIESWINASR